jgi:hypothetical protein
MVDPIILTHALTTNVNNDGPPSIVILQVDIEDLKTIFQRALNTWADCPPYLMSLSDKLEKL